MPFARFTVIDRAKQPFLLKTDESQTIGETVDDFFPGKKRYTFQMVLPTSSRILARTENLKDMLIEGMLTSSTVEYHLINLDEYIDIFLNPFTRKILKTSKSVLRIYCDESNTILDIENQLLNEFGSEAPIGLYGFYEKLFKFKPDNYVLFVKRCFPITYLFQLQILDNKNAMDHIKPKLEARFYRLDNLDQKILFKRTHLYSLRENTLCKIKDDKVHTCFFDVVGACVSYEKFYTRNVITLKNETMVWYLCTFSESVGQEMYQALKMIKSENCVRKVEKIDDRVNDNKNIYREVVPGNTRNLYKKSSGMSLREIKGDNTHNKQDAREDCRGKTRSETNCKNKQNGYLIDKKGVLQIDTGKSHYKTPKIDSAPKNKLEDFDKEQLLARLARIKICEKKSGRELK